MISSFATTTSSSRPTRSRARRGCSRSIGQMLLGPDPDLEVAEMSPWLDLRVPPKAVKLPVVEAQTHRRFLKTHLPIDASSFRRRPSTSISGAMAVMSCGASTTTTSTPMTPGMRRSTTRLGVSARRSSVRPGTSVSIGATGFRATATRSGRSGTTSEAGGKYATPQCHARALRESQARHAGTDAPHRSLPRHHHR